MRPFTYESPTDASSAVALASVPASGAVTSPVQYKGGGTTLVDLMKLDVMQPATVVDITGIADAGQPRKAPPPPPRVASTPGPAAAPRPPPARPHDGLRIGSLVSMAQLQADRSVVQDYPILTESLWQAASQQLRNMARLGGNVLQRTRCSYFRDTSYDQCNKRVPGSGCAALDGLNRAHAVLGTSDHCVALYAGDWAAALVALDARVEVLSPTGTRTMDVADLHRQPGATPHIETSLAPGDLITAFTVPTGPWRRALYRKIRDRQSYAFANASAAVAIDLDGDVLKDVRIGLGGVATVPWRARTAETLLRGRELTEDAAAAAAAAAVAAARARGPHSDKGARGGATMVRALLEARAMEVS